LPSQNAPTRCSRCRIALLEAAQRRAAGEVAAAERGHRLVVAALLLGVGRELAAVDADLLRLELRMRSSTPCCVSFDARCSSATSRVSCSSWPRSLAFSARSVRAGCSGRAGCAELADLVGHLRVQLGLARALLLVALLELLAQVEDRLARLVVVEQAGAGRRRDRRRRRARAPASGDRIAWWCFSG
jgi:hypothetical protein